MSYVIGIRILQLGLSIIGVSIPTVETRLYGICLGIITVIQIIL